MTKKGRPAADHPDLQLPARGTELGAVSVRVDATADLVQLRRAALVHPFDDPDVIAGQGTAGLEMMEQAEAIGAVPDVVLVGASGGGLIGGVSIAVKEKSPATTIYSVEPAGFDDLARSLKSGVREKNAARLRGNFPNDLTAVGAGWHASCVPRRGHAWRTGRRTLRSSSPRLAPRDNASPAIGVD